MDTGIFHTTRLINTGLKMAQYNITATSAYKNLTQTNTARPVLLNPEEAGMIKEQEPVIPFPSPAEFEDQAAADDNAAKYAKWLRLEGIDMTTDWVGHATAI
jgi:hypothetical protein